jgi:hypothetical protein
MENKEINRPPLVALKFFRWYCHPFIREEVEGDLLELFEKYAAKNGALKSKVFFLKEVLLLFRPSIIGDINHLNFKLFRDMKKIHWLQLIALNVAIIVCILLPFFPGRYDSLSLPFSVSAQLVGYIGLILVPIAILWFIQEIKKFARFTTPLNNWSSGYYYAITATSICTFISIVFVLALAVSIGFIAGIMAFIIIAFILNRQIKAIKALKSKTGFNAAPLYFLSIPLMALLVTTFFIVPISNHSRSSVIKQAEKVISALEQYHNETGNYPPAINYLYDVPTPEVVGVKEFIYELNGNAYNLAFVQHQHLGATREVVIYNKNDNHQVKGHFASFNADKPHWKYYWLD